MNYGIKTQSGISNVSQKDAITWLYGIKNHLIFFLETNLKHNTLQLWIKPATYRHPVTCQYIWIGIILQAGEVILYAFYI